MKGTDHFKRKIYMYLEQRAEEDALFAKKYRNPAKNMDECVTHILNYVQKSGCNGFTDGEIFGQAIHYYEENEIAEMTKAIKTHGHDGYPTDATDLQRLLCTADKLSRLCFNCAAYDECNWAAEKRNEKLEY